MTTYTATAFWLQFDAGCLQETDGPRGRQPGGNCARSYVNVLEHVAYTWAHGMHRPSRSHRPLLCVCLHVECIRTCIWHK